MSSNEKFWMDDLRELYQNNNYLKFFPRYEMTRTEQLNAITRFCLYFIILILIFDKNEDWLYIPITIIVLVVILYNVNNSDKNSRSKENTKIINNRLDRIEEEKQLENFVFRPDNETIVRTDIDNQYYNRSDDSLQSGFYDSNGILNVGSKNSPKICSNPNAQDVLTLDEMINLQKNTCRRPTVDNPLMNLNITDYNNGQPPAACNADDEEISDDIRVTFNHDLFRDVDELWERENSQRQFYTTPNHGVPNNSVEFAKWLYNNGSIPNCKTNQEDCLRYESLRDKRGPLPI